MLRRPRPMVVLLPALAALLAAAVGAGAATTTTVVTASVPSAVSLTNNCQNTAGYRFGLVAPNTPATTATGAGTCSFQFTSSNDSAMLRVGQKDGGLGARAMGLAAPTFTFTPADSDHLQDVDQYDTNLGWAIGYNGVLLQTTNGSAWTDRTAAAAGVISGTWMYGIDVAPGGTTAYGVGSGGKVVRIDAANTATPTYVDLTSRLGWGASYDVNAVLAVSSSEIIVVGQSGRIARSTNANLAAGSVTFSSYTIGGSTLRDIVLAAANTYYVGAGGAYWKTSNGAVNNLASDWASTATSSTIEALAAAGSGSILAAGFSGHVATSNGTTWTDRYDFTRTQSTFNGAALAGAAWPGVGWIAGEYGEVWKTTNGGVGWTRLATPTGNWIKSLSALNDQTLVAVGADRLVMRSDDGGTTWTKQNYAAGGESTAYGVDVDPANAQVAVAVGGSAGTATAARIRRTTNGAASWTTVVPPTSNALFGVDFSSSSVVWAVGEAGTILRSGDGGATWSAQASPTTLRLRAVAARNDSEVWAVGEQGVVVRTTNGGTSWTVVNAGASAVLNDVVVTTNGTVVIGGTNATLRRSTDGGATWSAASTKPATGTPILAMDATSDTAIYATEQWSWDLWKSTDGGASWSVANPSVGSEMFGLAAVGDVLFFTGDWGSSARSSDAGATVANTTSNANGTLYSVAAADSHTAYAVGEGGETERMLPQAGAATLVSDYAFNASDWDTAATTNMFGVCLQNVGGTTTVAPGWTKDTANTVAKCETLDTDPWAAIPASMTKLASTSGAGVTGQVDLVWGVRFTATQPPGDYSAAIVLEALAPNV